jgi:hypothetical protein
MRELIMKKMVLPLILCAFALCGCARHYVIRLSSGAELITANKPKLKGTYYLFKDATGRENRIPQSRVQEILPASMAKKEKSPFTSQ